MRLARVFSGRAVARDVESEEVNVFRARQKLERVSAYVAPDVKERLEKLGRAWTFIERLADPKAAGWSESQTVQRLIKSAMETAWIELEGEPQNEADWKQLEARLRATHAVTQPDEKKAKSR